jgi:hypothetical protein
MDIDIPPVWDRFLLSLQQPGALRQDLIALLSCNIWNKNTFHQMRMDTSPQPVDRRHSSYSIRDNNFERNDDPEEVDDPEDTFRQLVAELESTDTFIAHLSCSVFTGHYLPRINECDQHSWSLAPLALLSTFPTWTSFPLFSVTEEDIETTVRIFPVCGGRYAVPVVRKEGWKLSPNMTDLWNLCELSLSSPLESETYVLTIKKSLPIWINVMRLILTKSTFSFNEIIGTIVLGHSLIKIFNLDYYHMLHPACHAWDAEMRSSWARITRLFSKLDRMLLDNMRSEDKDIASLWEEAFRSFFFIIYEL